MTIITQNPWLVNSNAAFQAPRRRIAVTSCEIYNQLCSMSEKDYQKFSSSLMPSIDPTTVLGIRIPRLRAFAKKLSPTDAHAFLNDLPHTYFEENNLHAFLVADLKNFDDCIRELDRFLPYVDNWATCDSLRPVCFSKNPEKLRSAIDRWLKSTHPYTVRFAIEALMVHFLDELFDPRDLQRVAEIKSDHYYVNMMIAWYFATALAKQYESSVVFLQDRRLSPWLHQKTIQKATESDRLTPPQKEYLKTLRIKRPPKR